VDLRFVAGRLSLFIGERIALPLAVLYHPNADLLRMV
jgi:hypothetical protein